jgi:membrane associated rhomboid family serine protease
MYNKFFNSRLYSLPPAVKFLLLLNLIIFLIQQLLSLWIPEYVEQLFGISYAGFTYNKYFWQIFTYMFLHGGWLHLFFNLFALWMFGSELERLWGKNYFLKYYLLSGLGAGISIALMNWYAYVNYNVSPITIGASGAIYALLLAFGLIWPNREVLLYFLFPIKIKYLLIGFGLIEFFGTISSASGNNGGNISHIGHLGGLIAGFIIFKLYPPNRISKQSSISNVFKKLRLKRNQKIIANRIEARNIIDTLLDKIAKQGINSLTRKEKRSLEWARKHYSMKDNSTIH